MHFAHVFQGLFKMLEVESKVLTCLVLILVNISIFNYIWNVVEMLFENEREPFDWLKMGSAQAPMKRSNSPVNRQMRACVGWSYVNLFNPWSFSLVSRRRRTTLPPR